MIATKSRCRAADVTLSSNDVPKRPNTGINRALNQRFPSTFACSNKPTSSQIEPPEPAACTPSILRQLIPCANTSIGSWAQALTAFKKRVEERPAK